LGVWELETEHFNFVGYLDHQKMKLPVIISVNGTLESSNRSHRTIVRTHVVRGLALFSLPICCSESERRLCAGHEMSLSRGEVVDETERQFH
jgi:hypothetical protein